MWSVYLTIVICFTVGNNNCLNISLKDQPQSLIQQRSVDTVSKFNFILITKLTTGVYIFKEPVELAYCRLFAW